MDWPKTTAELRAEPETSMAQYRRNIADAGLEWRAERIADMLSLLNTSVAFFMAYPPEHHDEILAIVERKDITTNLGGGLEGTVRKTAEIVRDIIEEDS